MRLLEEASSANPVVLVDRIECIASTCHSAWYSYTVLILGEVGLMWSEASKDYREMMRGAVEFLDGLAASGEYDMRYRGKDIEKLCAALQGYYNENGAGSLLIPYYELSDTDRAKVRVVVRTYLAMRKVMEGARR